MNILFIGDYRPARNYGSIATSESMINLLHEVCSDKHDLKILDHRSYAKETPPEGYPPFKMTIKDKSYFKQKIKKFIPKTLIDLNVRYLQEDGKKIHVPFRFDQYEDFYKEIQIGKRFPYERKSLEWADIVVFSGEGTLVNGVDKFGRYLIGGLYLLFLLWLSKIKYHKRTIIVNHTVDPGGNKEADQIIKFIYPKLDFVGVRETASLNYLESLEVKSNVEFIPDALFTFKPKEINWSPSKEILRQIDFSKPYICIGDTSGIIVNKYYSGVRWDVVDVYTEIIKRLKEVTPQIIFVDGFRSLNEDINKIIRLNNIGYVNLLNCSYHDLYHVLKSSEIFVSGRWHNSILSVLANTPIVLMGADSHKTKSLYDILEYDAEFFELITMPIYVDNIIQEVRNILQNKDVVKMKLAKKVKELSLYSEDNVKYIRNLL